MFCQSNSETFSFQLLIKGGSFITPGGWLSINHYPKTVAAVNFLSKNQTVASEAHRVHVVADGLMLRSGTANLKKEKNPISRNKLSPQPYMGAKSGGSQLDQSTWAVYEGAAACGTKEKLLF